MAENIAWNAKRYDSVSTVQQEWGRRILSTIGLDGRETVLDGGCGTGRLTELLAEAVPQGQVLGVDYSAEMLEVAASRLAGSSNIRLLRADLTGLPLAGSVDMIFSNAVFHWVLDHDRLFRSLAGALQPGGRLMAQCGGFGNLEQTHAVVEKVMAAPRYARYFRSWREPYCFAKPEETERRLLAAGFHLVEASLSEAPTPFPTRHAFHDFVSTVILRSFQSALPPEERLSFVDAFVDACPAYHLDYVRLNLAARKTNHH